MAILYHQYRFERVRRYERPPAYGPTGRGGTVEARWRPPPRHPGSAGGVGATAGAASAAGGAVGATACSVGAAAGTNAGATGGAAGATASAVSGAAGAAGAAGNAAGALFRSSVSGTFPEDMDVDTSSQPGRARPHWQGSAALSAGVTVLQIWAWEHLPITRPLADRDRPVGRPYAEGDDSGDGDGYGGDARDQGAGDDDGGDDDGGDGRDDDEGDGRAVRVAATGTPGAGSSRSARDVYTDWMARVVRRRRSGPGDQEHQVPEQEGPLVEQVPMTVSRAEKPQAEGP
ncbi:uncharacterized protein LOC131074702 [Cryptomeria japonica]|uniref:uncharacterized protein LOC131074702 n=1 Tax=Cryptomeria japonica TaxID=3369 RepID=UPI0027DA142C|nr:uncharacterized protein LOC131074702 [Cryptomeria japonica]